MKEDKLKKDISDGVFVIVNNEVVPFNKKYKLAEMKSGDNGVLTFSDEEEGKSFLVGNNEIPMKSEKIEFVSDGYHNDSEDQRKKEKDGKYNIPITIVFARKNESEKKANELLKKMGFQGKVETKGKDIVLMEYKKSKRSILNKLKREQIRRLISFENRGNIITIR